MRGLPEFAGQEPPYLAWCTKLAWTILTTRPVKIERDFIDCQTLRTFRIGDVMCDHRLRQTDAEEPGQEREEDWHRILHSLQKCICELLIKNQELRMSLLNSATKHQSGEADQ